MGKTFSNTFGSRDKNATNDVLNGEVVATGTPGAKTVSDPNQGLSDDQIRSRKLAAMGLRRFGAAMAPGDQQQAPPVNFSYAGAQPNMQMPQPQNYRLPFYGNMGY